MYKNFIVVLLLFCVTWVVLLFAAGDHYDILIHSSFLIIIFQSLLLLFLFTSPIVKMYFTFVFLFLGCIPYLEHSQQIYSYWGMLEVTRIVLLQVNAIIFFLNLTVIFFYRFTGSLLFNDVQFLYSGSNLIAYFRRFKNNFIFVDEFLILFVLSLLSVCLILYVNDFNIKNLIFRTPSTDRIEFSGPVSLIINYIIKPIPGIVLIFYLCFQPKYYIRKSAVFFLFCLVNIFPTGVPRFYAAAVYLPIMILVFRSLLTKGRLSSFIILSIFFIFPSLNSFRRVSEFEGFKLFHGFGFLYHGHFDSYLSIGQVIQAGFISYGRQLLGNILFFIPRKIWPDKPTGTGHTLASSLDLGFANISANFYAEGFANFGYLGMFLFAGVMGWWLRKLDEMFYRKLTMGVGRNNLLPLYFVFLSFLVFILRGDLLSSISFFIGFALCIKFISLFFNEKNRS